jgi:LacI family transcriptional regulator
MSDVARAAGVHQATASRALNPSTSDLISTATVRRVQAAAEELGYTPNTAARSLRTNQSYTVGVLLPDLTNPLFPPIVRGIEEVLTEQGYTALLANTDNDEKREAAQFAALLGRQVDGFILATGLRDHPLVERAQAEGRQLVLVNRGTDVPRFPVVSGDDASGIGAAVDHLVALGHRKLAHLAGPHRMSTGVIRLRGFRSAVGRHGLAAADTTVAECSGYTVAAGEAAMRAVLDSAPEVTAVLAGNDLIAVGALHVLREHGLSCPEDVSLIGFNDMRFVDELSPPLTTVRVPHAELGREAARLLLRRLDEPELVTSVVLPTELVVRESTAPPRVG